MTEEERDFGSGASGGGKGMKIFIIISAVLMAAGLVVAAFLLLGETETADLNVERVIEHNTALDGVSVGGVDISRMTAEQAREATAHIEDELLGAARFEIDVDGQLTTYDAKTFEMYTDYEDMLAQAVAYGHSGDFETRKEAADTARENGVDFAVDTYIDREKVEPVVVELKTAMDTEPTAAGHVFTPWGHYEDGTPYTPDMEEMYQTSSKGDEFVFPAELVRIAPEDMPNKLRYLYYNHDDYWRDENDGEMYMPNAASISRFVYQAESYGLILDAPGTVDLILSAVEQDDYSLITAPVEITHTDTSIDETMQNTQLIASWTSSYRKHDGRNRIYNVSKLSSIICGVVIEPGETWSINEEAGPRNRSTGWKEAAGISGGAFTSQYGGGVCQISSTLYNAMIRADMEIVDKSNHSIVSDYIPRGLDATISTGKPDLKIKNPYDVPIYVVSYLNGEDQNVTVEVYGPPVVHATYGDVILGFSSERGGGAAEPAAIYYFNQTVTPEGDPIPVGGSITFVTGRSGSSANVYKHYYDLEGNELQEKEWIYKASYKAYAAKIYCNYPNPALPVPAPSAPAPTPAA